MYPNGGDVDSSSGVDGACWVKSQSAHLCGFLGDADVAGVYERNARIRLEATVGLEAQHGTSKSCTEG